MNDTYEISVNLLKVTLLFLSVVCNYLVYIARRMNQHAFQIPKTVFRKGKLSYETKKNVVNRYVILLLLLMLNRWRNNKDVNILSPTSHFS